MGLASIELDDEVKVVIADVLVLASPASAHPVLPVPRRQAMRPFDPGDIAELEQGLGAVLRCA